MKNLLLNNTVRIPEMMLLVVAGVISRLVPHPANMTAVGGAALVAGAKLPPGKAVVVMLVTMLVTDLLLGLHTVMWATYGSFLLTVFIGYMIRRSVRPVSVISAAIVSSVVFYLVTNFAVWVAPGAMYPKTVWGLAECYIMAIPFFRNSLLGDLAASTTLFIVYELVSGFSYVAHYQYIRTLTKSLRS